jgi:hypothetical protein
MFEWLIAGLVFSGTFVSYVIAFECGGCWKLAMNEVHASNIDQKIATRLEEAEERIIKSIDKLLKLPPPYERRPIGRF